MWARLRHRLLEVHDVDVVGRDLATPLPRQTAADRVQLVRVAAEDARLIESLPAAQQRSLRMSLDRGDAGWYASVDGSFAGWLWVSRVSHTDRWSGLHITLRPDEAYTYGWWVLPEHRKDGVAAALMAAALGELQTGGQVRRVYGWADRENKASQLQLRLLFGFRPVQTIRRMRVLDRWGRGIRGSENPADGPLSSSRRSRSADDPVRG